MVSPIPRTHTHSAIPAGVIERLAALEEKNNDLQEEVTDLSAKFIRLESDAQKAQLWYTSRIVSVWEGVLQMGERMTRSTDAMVQIIGEDSAKRRRLVELMEETHMCLGIPFPAHDAVLPPLSALVPSPAAILPPPNLSPAISGEPEIVRPPSPLPFDPDTTMGSADLPVTPPLLPTPIPPTTPTGTNAGQHENGELDSDHLTALPPPLKRRSGSMSVASTPAVVRFGGPKRALSAMPEGAEDDNRPKKQRHL